MTAVSLCLSLWCSGQKTFTVEEAVETIGFGKFHIALFLIMGSTGVGVCSRLHWPEKKGSSLFPHCCAITTINMHCSSFFFTHTFPSRISTVVTFGQIRYWPQVISGQSQASFSCLEHCPIRQHWWGTSSIAPEGLVQSLGSMFHAIPRAAKPCPTWHGRAAIPTPLCI